jgi:transcriptional regulator with XRE-family HTH domain
MSVEAAYGATVAKRRLARVLAELRTESGLTANQACDKLGWGRGKVNRFEANVWRRPEMSDIRDLLRIYGVTDEERQADVERLAIRARQRPWWREYPEVFSNEYAGFENDASRISIYLPLIVPVLLQTPAYIRAQLSIGPHEAAWRERALEARLRRQHVLEREDGTAPELRVVMTEASLRYRWGSDEDWRDQINHLASMSQRPNIDLRILRFADGPHPGMCTLITRFDFPEASEDPPVVYVEDDIMMTEVDDDLRATYSRIFDRIVDAAIERDATATFLAHLATQESP